MTNLSNKLAALDACHEAVIWVGDQTPEHAWAECQRGDWMLWIAKKAGVDLRTMARAKTECARLVGHLMRDPRSINALVVAERYADGAANEQELAASASAAYDAAYAAAAATYAAATAAYAAYAAADAADAAYAAAYAAYAAADAADAAYAAAYAAADAAYAAAAATYAAADVKHAEILSRCADICRQHIPLTAVMKGLK